MKIAFYVEDGLEQIVLTPETKTEKGIIGKLHREERELKIHQGSFYHCQGGWVRGQVYGRVQDQEDDKSTIIVLTPKANPEEM